MLTVKFLKILATRVGKHYCTLHDIGIKEKISEWLHNINITVNIMNISLIKEFKYFMSKFTIQVLIIHFL